MTQKLKPSDIQVLSTPKNGKIFNGEISSKTTIEPKIQRKEDKNEYLL